VEIHPAITILSNVVIMTAVDMYLSGKSVNLRKYAKIANIGIVNK